MKLEINKSYLGDCLEIMPSIDDKSIDLILCDLPFGVTKNKWDIIIPLDKLWEQLYNDLDGRKVLSDWNRKIEIISVSLPHV